MKTGIELIAKERQEQIEKHGYDLAHDLNYKNDELIKAALAYIHCDYDGDPFYDQRGWLKDGYNVTIDDIVYETENQLPDVEVPKDWPFHYKFWKGYENTKIERLKKAGAFIAAAIDCLQAVAANYLPIQRDCPNCQGGGCTVCGGSGYIIN